MLLFLFFFLNFQLFIKLRNLSILNLKLILCSKLLHN